MDVVLRTLEDMLGPGPFLELLTQIGTFAGAISGVRLACAKRFDWFGAYVIGFVTAVGGGTIRDVFLGLRPFWLESPSYLATTLFAVLAVFLFGRRFISEQITWFIFDTISISIFMLIGMEKTIGFYVREAAAAGIDFGMDEIVGCWWRAISMGVITAVFGGIVRDIFINEVPLIFRKEIYALACAAGGFVYFALAFVHSRGWCEIDRRVCGIICIIVIFVVRALAIKYHLGVPVLTGRRPKLLHPHHGARRVREKRLGGSGPQGEK